MTDTRRGPIEIRERLDVHAVVRAARAIAAEAGFSTHRRAELDIVVSELATNILRHARRGAVQVFGPHGTPAEIRVEAIDTGPQIEDFARALQDGSDPSGPLDPLVRTRRPGLATGLGAVARLSDGLQHTRTSAGGNQIVARLRDRPLRASFSPTSG